MFEMENVRPNGEVKMSTHEVEAYIKENPYEAYHKGYLEYPIAKLFFQTQLLKEAESEEHTPESLYFLSVLSGHIPYEGTASLTDLVLAMHSVIPYLVEDAEEKPSFTVEQLQLTTDFIEEVSLGEKDKPVNLKRFMPILRDVYRIVTDFYTVDLLG